MRDILFKGKRPDTGEWVEGYIVRHGTTTWIYTGEVIDTGKIEPVYGLPYFKPEKYVVDPDTICQCTGLTDKNGNKIWENDIVESARYDWDDDPPDVAGVVRFGTGTFDGGAYEYNGWVVKEKDGNTDSTPLIEYEKYMGTYYGYCIIGNIFDNPDMLEKEILYD